MPRSTRIALAVCLPIFAVAVFLSWRKVTAAPDGDITGMPVATICGAARVDLAGGLASGPRAVTRKATYGA